MKIIIAGGRDFSDYKLMEKEFLSYLLDNNIDVNSVSNIEIVSGSARGADWLGEVLSANYKILCKKFPAEWNLYGRSAGYKRNALMAEYADGLIAFWDGKSKGTEHMINLAKSKNLKVKVVKY